ncbi:ethanolamine ammonia-lyase light chain [Mucilaginibacter gracilis]|uniref:Ethanolamine ammonia-lyase small subunit n=1 Tax=Mucilaginibacter gracilis TaxID=423350 RepID=A0A495J0V4_9SPHI|nr:ethanolamine ammonia-lyase subunit EutC [Mucilaginibacter gracilis]RKR82577.1 ethanolamine ammonia-lyase light chain [Mucilaginibacter gracilis]
MAEIEKPDRAGNDDMWFSLREFTAARIAIGRTGNSIPLSELLDFKLAHAHARDAVYSTLDVEGIAKNIQQFKLPVFTLHSRAASRAKYLTRPDYGRTLNDESIEELTTYNGLETDVAIVIADGLSAMAVNQFAVELLQYLVPKLTGAGLKLAPISLVEQGRVAIADEIGFAFNTNLSLILIGERPGLSSPDSMGAYLTYKPQHGLTDESRNCISNIRPDGLAPAAAADKIFYLINEALKRKLTGVDLKDNHGLLGE